MLNILKEWKESALLSSIDYHFAAFIAQLGGDNLTQLSAALTSEYLGMGHICLPVDEIVKQLNKKCYISQISLQEFCLQHELECLLKNGAETHAQLNESLCIADNAPLSLQFNALYLRRYALFEQLVCDKLLNQPVINVPESIKEKLDLLFATDYRYIWQAWESDKTQSIVLLCEKFLDVTESATLNWPEIECVFTDAKKSDDLVVLEKLIPLSARCDWQKVSVALALSAARIVISGGPGTGKTTTVSKLLVLLLEAEPDLQIKMVAPTGKAAARLSESISNALTSLSIETELKDKIPTEASTIHRLLGVKAGSNHFRFNQNQKLNLDLLLVDEASMVDLPLMAKLLMALPDHARLILLGDKDQLSSVEAGAVLGDICSFIGTPYSQHKAKQLAQLTGFSCLLKNRQNEAGMADNLCLLQKSYRFDQYSGIGYLAKAINQGDASNDKIAQLCENYSDLTLHENNLLSINALEKLILTGYRPYLERVTCITSENRNSVKTMLTVFNQFKLLCAIREGEWGVKNINLLSEKVLMQAGLIADVAENNWYVGRPIMITQNSYHLGLYNGDIGICLLDENKQLRIYFQMADGHIADFQPSRLPSFETVFAMTVHKSQGSEFEHTVLILPETNLAVVTRELIYTGITRAKKELTLFADLNLMATAVKHKTERFSRLVDRLKQGIKP